MAVGRRHCCLLPWYTLLSHQRQLLVYELVYKSSDLRMSLIKSLPADETHVCQVATEP